MLCALSFACSSSIAPTAPSLPLAAPESRALFATSGAPFGSLILAGSATLAHVGEPTTITVRLDPSVASMRWTFGDGATSALARTIIQHYYQTAGTFHATLTVTSFAGQSETAEGDIGVLPAFAPTPTPQPQPPAFGVSLTASWVSVGTATSFTITLSGIAVSDVASAVINYGDGQSELISTATPSHTYAVAGYYIAGVTVTDTAGHSQHTTAGVLVRVGQEPPGPASLTLSVSVNPAPVGNGTLIVIGVSAVSTPLPGLYEVDCTADGTYDQSSAGNAFVCVYPIAGTYTARVRASNGILTATATSDPFVVQP